MKNFNTPSKGVVINTKDFEHLYNVTKDITEALASVLTENTSPVRISGVEFTITNNNKTFECTEGWLLYQNTFYKVEPFSGTATGTQIPVFNLDNTKLAHEPHDLLEGYNKVGTFDICTEEKLKLEFGASGTGLFDYNAIIKHPVKRNSEVIADLQGLVSGMIVPYYNQNWQAKFSATGLGVDDLIGYAICNGRNGTPDLRGMMIVGATDGNPAQGNPNANDSELDSVEHLNEITGNSKINLVEGQLPSHSHGVTDPEHTHTVGGSGDLFSTFGSIQVAGGSSGDFSVSNTSYNSTNKSSTGISIDPTGSGDDIDIRPPARIMLYLMKL
ncbi:hypothetical protein [Flammeovirga aprica]|uniref:Phage tail collar domain-containing protein n=1 Tax=Flammeovirga aprica JL-4 TaxID=694437 RepID=A0A7X9X9Q7_9BACT|nr:hypothetical protein [Flammeovirga aprica]NME68996.1 hypothetical protein [Flammeovirga aprica JL-4]